METISVAITDSSNVQCLDLYLINIFMNSTKADAQTLYMFQADTLFLCVTVEDLNL